MNIPAYVIENNTVADPITTSTPTFDASEQNMIMSATSTSSTNPDVSDADKQNYVTSQHNISSSPTTTISSSTTKVSKTDVESTNENMTLGPITSKLETFNEISTLESIERDMYNITIDVVIANLREDPTEAEGAAVIGSSMILIVVALLAIIVISDFEKLMSDFRKGLRNLYSSDLFNVCRR